MREGIKHKMKKKKDIHQRSKLITELNNKGKTQRSKQATKSHNRLKIIL